MHLCESDFSTLSLCFILDGNVVLPLKQSTEVDGSFRQMAQFSSYIKWNVNTQKATNTTLSCSQVCCSMSVDIWHSALSRCQTLQIKKIKILHISATVKSCSAFPEHQSWVLSTEPETVRHRGIWDIMSWDLQVDTHVPLAAPQAIWCSSHSLNRSRDWTTQSIPGQF